MDLRRLQRVVVDALDDIKAQDIRVFNTTGQTDLFDRVIIATGTSNRQTRSLAAHVREKVKEAGGSVISVEGSDTGEWVLVDLGDAVVHIMQPAIRAYYNLEEIWGAKPVRMQVARPPAGSRAASFARETDGVRAAVPTRPASAKPSTTRSAGNKPPADKPPAGKPPAKKSSAKKSSAKKSSANKPTANKPTAKRPAAKSPSARAPAAGASAAKRPTARKRKPASTR